jgi:nitrate reductase alpha subunit
VLKEFFVGRKVPYFEDYARRYTDLPILVRLRKDGERWVPDRYLRQSDLPGSPSSDSAAWKTVALAEKNGEPVVPQGSMG